MAIWLDSFAKLPTDEERKILKGIKAKQIDHIPYMN